MCNECGPHECVCDFEKSLDNMTLNDAVITLKYHDMFNQGYQFQDPNPKELSRAIYLILEYVEKDLK